MIQYLRERVKHERKQLLTSSGARSKARQNNGNIRGPLSSSSGWSIWEMVLEEVVCQVVARYWFKPRQLGQYAGIHHVPVRQESHNT